MKSTFAILLLFSFLSCVNDKKRDIPNSNSQIESEIEYEPIFLNLSPSMTDINFEKKLKSSVPNGKFLIPINKYNFEFNIEKYSDRIILEYNQIKTLQFPDKFGKNAERRYSDFIKKDPSEEILIDDFVKIFKKKYSTQIKELPLLKNKRGEYFNNQPLPWAERTLRNYDFNQENYLIFQDSIKTVLVGYTILDYPRTLDNEALEAITFKVKKSNIKSSYEESDKSIDLYKLLIDEIKEQEKLTPYQRALQKTSFENPITIKKGFSLEINYIHNSDFAILKKRIDNANQEFNNKLKISDSLLKLKRENESKNLNEI